LDKELERTQGELEVVNGRLETAAKQASDVSFRLISMTWYFPFY